MKKICLFHRFDLLWEYTFTNLYLPLQSMCCHFCNGPPFFHREPCNRVSVTWKCKNWIRLPHKTNIQYAVALMSLMTFSFQEFHMSSSLCCRSALILKKKWNYVQSGFNTWVLCDTNSGPQRRLKSNIHDSFTTTKSQSSPSLILSLDLRKTFCSKFLLLSLYFQQSWLCPRGLSFL